MNHLKALLTLACLAIASPALAQRYMDFGGMYGYAADCTNGVCGNPYANNTDACPTGFTAYQVAGRPGPAAPADMPVYVCGRILSETNSNPPAPVADFGGIFGTFIANPITGATTCPAGYTQTQVLGTYNLDYGLFYCHRAPSSSAPRYRLGGIYTYYFNGSVDTYYPNPVLTTLKDACPTNYSSGKAFGINWADANLFFCYTSI
jgi:hypothetical protein